MTVSGSRDSRHSDGPHERAGGMRVLIAPDAMRPEPGGCPLPGLGLGARETALALARGWTGRRPGDAVTVLPVPDGGPGSAEAVPADRVAERSLLTAGDALGCPREVALVRLLTPGAHGAGPGTWYLDAASLAPVPASRAEAAREAREATSRGLGDLLDAALRIVPVAGTLVIGLGRSCAHDGGEGLVAALGGAQAAVTLTEGREIILALGDETALGGLSGTGQALSGLASLEAEEVQDLDRRACSTASVLVSSIDALREAPTAPLLAAPGERLTPTSWGTGAGGGAAMVLRALGARALPGAGVWAGLLGLGTAVADADLVVTATGEAYDVLAGSVIAVVGETAQDAALPCVLVAGRCAVPRGELAGAGLVASYALEDLPGLPARASWDDGGAAGIAERLADLGSRLARTWSR